MKQKTGNKGTADHGGLMPKEEYADIEKKRARQRERERGRERDLFLEQETMDTEVGLYLRYQWVC